MSRLPLRAIALFVGAALLLLVVVSRWRGESAAGAGVGLRDRGGRGEGRTILDVWGAGGVPTDAGDARADFCDVADSGAPAASAVAVTPYVVGDAPPACSWVELRYQRFAGAPLHMCECASAPCVEHAGE